MKNSILTCLFIFTIFQPSIHADVNFPFPQENNFNECIKPDISQKQLNEHIVEFYEQVKFGNESYSGYLYNYPAPNDNLYCIKAGYTGSTPESWGDIGAITQSEANGYGMIIFALMAGYDPEAQTYFNGLLDLYLAHRSTICNSGMSWIIPSVIDPELERDASATDGDFDIAYALILAHNQWGSSNRDYLNIARDLINESVLQYDISQETKRILLGDWNRGLAGGHTGSSYMDRFNETCTRPSDWMVSHLRTFKTVPGIFNPELLDDAINEVYRILPLVQNPQTGLVPDFVEDIDGHPQPVICNLGDEGYLYFLEAPTDDDYSYNACRVPLRIAADFAHHTSKKAKKALYKINNWSTSLPVENEYERWPEQIWHGYELDGTRLDPDAEWSWDLCFVSPLVTSLIIDPDKQEKLTDGWNFIRNNFSGDHTIEEGWSGYYSDVLTLLSMLLISGNWFDPTDIIDWNGQIAYRCGEEVMYNEKRYKAKWWTKGECPENNNSGVWKIVTVPSHYHNWMASQVYVNGDMVVFNENVYRARWWTMNDEPYSSEYGPWELIQ